MRRWLGLGAVAALLATATAGWAASRMIADRVACTSTKTTIVSGNVERERLILQNAGTIHANVGQGDRLLTMHAYGALGSHAAAGTGRLDLGNFTGYVDCQTQVGDGGTLIEVLQLLK